MGNYRDRDRLPPTIAMQQVEGGAPYLFVDSLPAYKPLSYDTAQTFPVLPYPFPESDPTKFVGSEKEYTLMREMFHQQPPQEQFVLIASREANTHSLEFITPQQREDARRTLMLF